MFSSQALKSLHFFYRLYFDSLSWGQFLKTNFGKSLRFLELQKRREQIRLILAYNLLEPVMPALADVTSPMQLSEGGVILIPEDGGLLFDLCAAFE